MTVLISPVTDNCIIMLCDTRVVGECDIERRSQRKFYWSESLPYCVTTWGARRLWPSLQLLLMRQPIGTSVDELACRIYDFVSNEHGEDDEDFGFHIGGWGPDGPSLYHVYYGVDQPVRERNADQHAAIEKVTPPHRQGDSGLGILFNGRHDIVGSYIEHYVRELSSPVADRGRDPLTNYPMVETHPPVYGGGTLAIAPRLRTDLDMLAGSFHTDSLISASLKFARIAESATQGIEVGPPYQVVTLDGESVKKSTYNRP